MDLTCDARFVNNGSETDAVVEYDKVEKKLLKKVLSTFNVYIPSYTYEDYAQLARLSIFEAISRFDDTRGTLVQLATTIFYNKLATLMAKASRRNNIAEIEFEDPVYIEKLVDEREVVDFTPPTDISHILAYVRKKLSEKEYYAWVTITFDGKTYLEVADELWVTEKSVDNYYNKAKKKLKNDTYLQDLVKEIFP